MTTFGVRLISNVQRYQSATGEQTMVVVIERRDSGMAIHHVGFDAHVGLLVDGRPPALLWFQEAEDFHPLQWPPVLLH